MEQRRCTRAGGAAWEEEERKLVGIQQFTFLSWAEAQSHVGGYLPRGSLRAEKNIVPVNRNRKLSSLKEQFYVHENILLGERTVLSGTIFL